ncbi:MAG: beta-propeller domain-containing protein [Labilithrix sp.]|nr:beta-propeller domain-containing protein [Labilithrix sp.]
MKRILLPFAPPILVALVGSLPGCSSGSEEEYNQCIDAVAASMTPPAPATAAGPFRAELLETDPAGAPEIVREKLREDMHQSVHAARANAIARKRCEALKPPARSVGLFGVSSAESSDDAASGPSQSAGGGASQVSGTNNQIAGVDEADFVKNDTKHIYVASGSHLRIVEAWPAATAHEIAKVALPGTAKKLFVDGDRALVYSAVSQNGQNGQSGRYGRPSYGGASECTYGYQCSFQGDGSATVISIFDIADRAAPKLLRTIESSSSLLAARRVGSTVHTVLSQQPPNGASYWSTYPEGLKSGAGEDAINAAYDELVRQNEARVAAIDVSRVLPVTKDSGGQAPGALLFRSSMPDGAAVTSVLSLDLGADPAVKMVSVISKPGAVFASSEAIYMAVPHGQQAGWGWYEGRAERELSTIHKFSIGTSPLATSYRTSGVVKGRVLNQFAMDEKDGKLRIATTTGHLPSPDAHNTLSVLEDQGQKLDVIGQLDHIAKSEDIRSVRFDGDRGYVVTFKKTDPLFVFDLSDPRAPRTLAELKIPGFSTYMHMMDASHLLTIGYDSEDHGSFAYFTGVLLQIFDVSDPQNPRLAHKEVIGTRGSSSEALTNHLAFTYFGPKQLLALPMTICEGGAGNGSYGANMTFSGLMVYGVTPGGGFEARGRVAHPNGQYGSYESSACMNWWTNASSEVRRSIIMDDFVFSVSNRRIKVNDLRALGDDVKEIPLEDGSSSQEL